MRKSAASAAIDTKELLFEPAGSYICFPGDPERAGLFSAYNSKRMNSADYQCAFIVLSYALIYNIPCVINTTLPNDGNTPFYDELPKEVIDIYRWCPEIFNITATTEMSSRLANVGSHVKPRKPDGLYWVISQDAIDRIANNRSLFVERTVGRDDTYYLKRHTLEEYLGHKLNTPVLNINFNRNIFKRDQRYVVSMYSILSDLIKGGEAIMNEEYDEDV